jgi:hypothetical protein
MPREEVAVQEVALDGPNANARRRPAEGRMKLSPALSLDQGALGSGAGLLKF